NVRTNKVQDQVKVETVSGTLNVNTGDDNDIITVFDDSGDAASAGAVLNLDGGLADDDYVLTLAGTTGLHINVADSGGGFGHDDLIINGTEERKDAFGNVIHGQDVFTFDPDATDGIVIAGNKY